MAHTGRRLQDAPCCTHTRHSANAAKPSARPVQPVPAVLHKLKPTLVQLARMCTLVRACVRACAEGEGMPAFRGGRGVGRSAAAVERVAASCSRSAAARLHAVWEQDGRSASLGDGYTLLH